MGWEQGQDLAGDGTKMAMGTVLGFERGRDEDRTERGTRTRIAETRWGQRQEGARHAALTSRKEPLQRRSL